MKFVSTRGGAPAVSIAEAIRQGVAPDGGLYVPAAPATVDASRLDADAPLPVLAAAILAPFFEGDPLGAQLEAICAEALDFPAPLVAYDPAEPDLRLLELFHGPTGAFKDFGARFLMACFDRLNDGPEPLTVLVATSGDTGGAVGCAAEGRLGVRSVILFPRGRVSPFQRLQLSCWAPPNLSFEVEGDFDDCQAMAKAAFADPELTERHRLTSANSINVGRLLPQAAYLGAAALKLQRETGTEPGLVIPTGNLGHAVAALWARRLGLPVGPVIAATNANPTLHDWARTGRFRPGPSLRTIANAMDVGAPSNFERLVEIQRDQRQLYVERVEDEAIRRRLRLEHKRTGAILCPHTAAGAEAWHRIDPALRAERPWILAATAHPYKFAEIVEPIVEEKLRPPAALSVIEGRAARAVRIPANLDALARALDPDDAADAADGNMEAA